MVLFSITGIALTVTAVFLTTEFLYNGIKLTRGPSMAVFILPVLPVFIGGFLFAYLIPSFIRRLYLHRAFTGRALRLIGSIGLVDALIGGVRIIVLDRLLKADIGVTITLVGTPYVYTTAAFLVFGISAFVTGSILVRRSLGS